MAPQNVASHTQIQLTEYWCSYCEDRLFGVIIG